MTPLKPKSLIDRTWLVFEVLGEGGSGAVYRCRCPDPLPGVRHVKGRDYAVKMLHTTDPESVDRFRREAQVMARIQSRHVVATHHFGLHEGQPYLVLDYVGGGNVREYLQEKHCLPVPEAAWILLQAVIGVRHAHALGVIHRDLKPENLLIARPEGPSRKSVEFIPGNIAAASIIKVADFGLAKAATQVDQSLTRTGAVFGTPPYMSPEQCVNAKSVSVKTDVYSFGIMLYELVTGRLVFTASDMYQVMAAHVNEHPVLDETVDPGVRALVLRCLEKNPANRCTLRDLAEALRTMSGTSGYGSGESTLMRNGAGSAGWMRSLWSKVVKLVRGGR